MKFALPIVAGALVALSVGPAAALAQAATITPRNIMAGISSSGPDQVWVRADGQAPGVANECMYQGWSLFYASTNGDVAPEKVEAIALTAKASNIPLFIAYVVETGPSDFWGWGITRCRILRISLGV
ncbi:MAG: hypothetical protein JF617_07665 [Burkholderiales bacterium]|nr:hypothetical protein [Burkholderiales bacterium]